MQIHGVNGLAEFAFVAVAPEGFANYFAVAIVDRRGEALLPIRLEGTPIEDFKHCTPTTCS